MTTGNRQWDSVRAALWTLVGASVVVAVFFLALAGIAPSQAKVATVVLAVLAVLWIVHSWPRFTSRVSTHISRSDRERRGF